VPNWQLFSTQFSEHSTSHRSKSLLFQGDANSLSRPVEFGTRIESTSLQILKNLESFDRLTQSKEIEEISEVLTREEGVVK
jgi:hypothetical protein